jgi:N-methylhydantoinase B
MKHFMDYGEQVTLKALSELPKGRFELAEEQDDGQIFKVAIEITDNEFIVDLRDNPDQQKSPNNSSRDGVTVAAQMAMKAVTDPTAPANGGSFRPLRILTRPGSMFDAQEPAAHGFYYEVEIRVFDVMLRCLAPHVANHLSAGSFASICGTVIGGPHPDTGRHFTIIEPEIGGWGAMKGRDGNSAIFSGFHGETFNCPAEVAEARYGLTVDQFALNPEEGGEGRWRGGKGIRMDYRVRSDGTFLTCGYTRTRILPWSMAGANEGTPNYIEVRRKGGEHQRYAFATGVALKKGDVIRVVTGNGGGYGNPKERDPKAIAEDIKNGYITEKRAREVYAR